MRDAEVEDQAPGYVLLNRAVVYTGKSNSDKTDVPVPPQIIEFARSKLHEFSSSLCDKPREFQRLVRTKHSQAWLPSVNERLSQFSREARLHRAKKKMKGLEPHHWVVARWN